jgi:hypothetical protein
MQNVGALGYLVASFRLLGVYELPGSRLMELRLIL